jgi:hypothetical protein
MVIQFLDLRNNLNKNLLSVTRLLYYRARSPHQAPSIDKYGSHDMEHDNCFSSVKLVKDCEWLASQFTKRHVWHHALLDAPALSLRCIVAEELYAAVAHGDLDLEHITRPEVLGAVCHLGVGINTTSHSHSH